MTVEVYARNDGRFCQKCAAAKAWLTKLGVPFTEVELTDEAADNFRAGGFSEQPIIVHGERVYSGFRPRDLEAVAKAYRYFEG